MKQAVLGDTFKPKIENSLEDIKPKAFILSIENPEEISFTLDLWFLCSTNFSPRDMFLVTIFILIIGYKSHARSCV